MDHTQLWFAVVNPSSANGKTADRWPYFRKRFRNDGWTVEYAFTTQPEDAILIAREALKNGYQKIMSVGGDGTLNEVINGFFENGQLINPESELAVVGHGTGGDFNRTLAIPKGIESFLTLLKRRNLSQLDVGLVNYLNHHGNSCSRYFINVADVGLGGQTAALVNQKSKILGGKLSFFSGSITSILNYTNKPMYCSIDNKIFIEDKINSIIVANGRFFGGGMMIAPEAKLDDGWLDIIILGNFSTPALLYHLPKLYSGKHLKVQGVSYYRGKTIRIESPEPLLLEADGEHLGTAPVEFSIRPQAIKVWC